MIFFWFYEYFVTWFYEYFVPMNGFVALCQEIRNTFNAHADVLLEYFKDTYISQFCWNPMRHDPLFFLNL